MFRNSRTPKLIRAGITVMMMSLALTQATSASASSSMENPVISDFLASPSTLPSAGGVVTATANVTNSNACGFEVTSYSSSFGGSAKNIQGTCNYTFTVPANPLAVTMFVAVIITVASSRPFAAPIQSQITLSVASNSSSNTSTSTTTTTVPQVVGNVISISAGPDALLFAGPYVWVASCNADAVIQIVATTHQVLQEFTSSQYGFVCPNLLTLVGGNIWIANARNNSVTVINASTGAWVQTLTGMGISDVSSITSAGSDVWLGGENGFTSSYLSEYTTSGVFVRSINTYPRVSAPTCITSDGIDIWVTSPEYQRFAEFNAQTGAYLRSSALVEEPTCIFYHGGRIWATTTTGNDDLFEFSASTGALLRHVKDADSAGEITFGSTSLFANRWYAGTASVVEYTYAGRIVKTLVSERDTRSIVFGTLAVVGKSLWTTNYLHKAIDIVPTS